jgi:hypothetical protein
MKSMSSGICRRVVRWVAPYVSEEHIASIFKGEELVQQTSEQAGGKQRHIPEDDTLHNHRCENLKSYTENVYVLQCAANQKGLRTTVLGYG